MVQVSIGLQPVWVGEFNPIGLKKLTQLGSKSKPNQTVGSVRFENLGLYFGLGTIQVTTIQFPEIRQAAT